MYGSTLAFLPDGTTEFFRLNARADDLPELTPRIEDAVRQLDAK
jgi:hypothetical protein